MKNSLITLIGRQSKSIRSLTGFGIGKLKVIVLCLVFSCSLSYGSVMEKSLMKAGVAKAVITNRTAGVMANGNTSNGTLHDIHARALVLNDGVKRMIFVTYDLNCLDVGTPILRKRVKDELGIDPAQLVLLATHNHSATIQIDPANFEYGKWLADRIFDLIKEAIDNEKGPVTLKFGFGNGYFIRDIRRSGGNEPIDYEIQALKVMFKNKPIAVLFNQPTHPAMAEGPKIEPGHPGYAMDEIEQNYPGILALYGDASGGNQMPTGLNSIYNLGEEKSKMVGHLLAQRLIEIMEAPMENITGPIQTRLERVSLPLAAPISKDSALVLAKKFPKDVGFVSFPNEYRETNWVRMLLRYYEKNIPFPKGTDEMVCTYDTYLINKSDKELLEKYASTIHSDYPCIYEEVIVSCIGKMAFVAMQGEVCAPIGMRIKDAFRTTMPIMVFAYMGEHNLYIPTREIVRQNVYQAQTIQIQYGSPVGYAPEVEDVMVDAVIKMTKSIMEDNPQQNNEGTGKVSLLKIVH
jgi:hypothetical protein